MLVLTHVDKLLFGQKREEEHGKVKSNIFIFMMSAPAVFFTYFIAIQNTRFSEYSRFQGWQETESKFACTRVHMPCLHRSLVTQLNYSTSITFHAKAPFPVVVIFYTYMYRFL